MTGANRGGRQARRLRADAAQIIARYPQARSALLPLLHLVQTEDGYVSPDGIAFCADVLDLTTAEVSAVATFYTQYKRHPNGEYTVGVCTNTLCAVMGGDAIFDSLKEHLGVGHDETTEDGKVTLERIECNAACDYAPGDDGQLGVLRQPDADLGARPGRPDPGRSRGRPDPRREHGGHLQAGVPGAGRLRRRPGRRGRRGRHADPARHRAGPAIGADGRSGPAGSTSRADTASAAAPGPGPGGPEPTGPAGTGRHAAVSRRSGHRGRERTEG